MIDHSRVDARPLLALMMVLFSLPIALASTVQLNYIYVQQGNYSYQYQLMGDSVLIPQKCSSGFTDWLIYPDPRSQIGISNIQVIYSNGTAAPYIGFYSPKYASLTTPCGSVYGLYVTLGQYPPPSPYGYLEPGVNYTVKLAPGGNNITIPIPPGFSFLYALIKVVFIGPGSVVIKSPFVHPINAVKNYTEVGGFQLPVTQETIITFTPQALIYLNASGLAYASITPTYYTTVFNTGTAYLIGQPFYDVEYRGVSIASPTQLFPSQSLVRNASISSITTEPASISITPACSNLIVSGGQYSGGKLRVKVPSNVTLFLNGAPFMNLSIGSIPTGSASLGLNVLSSGISIVSLDGKLLNGTVVLSNGRSTIRPGPGVCVPPGTYSAIVVAGNYSFQLGHVNVTLLDPYITIPLFYKTSMTIKTNATTCPGSPYLLVNGERKQYGSPVSLSYVRNSSSVSLELVLDGVVLSQRDVVINGTNESIYMPVNSMKVRVTDILGFPISNYVVMIGNNLTYFDARTICIPYSASFVVVQVNGQDYVVKMAPIVHVTVLWPLTFKSIMVISSLIIIMLIAAVVAIAKKHSNEVVTV